MDPLADPDFVIGGSLPSLPDLPLDPPLIGRRAPPGPENEVEVNPLLRRPAYALVGTVYCHLSAQKKILRKIL